MNAKFQAGAYGVLLALIVSGSGLIAAEEAEPGSNPSVELRQEVVDLRERIESSDLEEPFKAPALGVLKDASAKVEEADDLRLKLLELNKESPIAADEVARLEQELAALPSLDDPLRELPEDVASLRGQLEAERAEIAKLTTELEEADGKLAELRELPVRVANRLPQANTELAQMKARLGLLGDPAEDSLTASADRLLLEAEVASLEAEVALLGSQRVGHPSRERIATLEGQLVRDRLKQLREAEGQLEEVLGRRLQSEADKFREEVSALTERSKSSTVRKLADELLPLVAQLEEAIISIESARDRAKVTALKLENLRKESQRLRRQVAVGGKDGALSPILLDRQRRLEPRRSLDFNLSQLDEEVAEAQLAGFRLEDLREDQDELELRWEKNTEVQQVLKRRSELLTRLLNSQRALIQELASLSADRRAYRNLTAEFSKFLSEQLFLTRSSPPINGKFFTDMPGAVGWILAPEHWKELGRSLLLVPVRHPFATAFVGLIIGLLLAMRRRLRASIERSGKRIRKISTDRIVHTYRGLLDTVLLALPLPLAMAYLAWALSSQPWADTWVRGLGSWLGWASWALMWIFSLRELAREEGVGRRHFGWEAESSETLRHSLKLIAVIYLPMLLIAGLTVYESNAVYFDSIGRLGFFIAECSIAWAFWKMLHPSTGVFSAIIEERPDRLLAKWRHLWIALAAGFPVVLAMMLAFGYGITSLVLGEVFHTCIRWVAVGVVVYGLLLRMFMIRTRRLGLQEALARRQARRESQEEGGGGGEEEASAGEMVGVDEEEVEMDLKDVAQQMRRLLRSLVGIGVVLAMVYSISAALPLERVAGVEAVDQFTWLGLFNAILIGAVGMTLIRNLPGLLDLAGMRESGVEPGVRYAVATLCQYAVGAVAVLMATQALAVDWAQFGWIAAALSVGLGFGLQEVVANFVCGIIILFERPMRVGDVVTIGEVTGTVSRIRMRATTITNWDRQEFVVPNKDFITGSLINWTLTSPINRLTLRVGVAYGTNTAVARQILTEVAEAHPLIMEDPAPLINFETFGDSTLDLSIRCYLPTMDNRLKAVTEMNEEIDRRFSEAGIEIAFPQRDLHIRTMPSKEDPEGLPGTP